MDARTYVEGLKKALKNEFGNIVSAQQHEDDLEQLVGLKKQLEKKLADAYEEVEEQRQKAQRKRLAREKEIAIAIAEKFTIEQNLSNARLEIELKEERLRTLDQELEELTFGGKTEEDAAQLKKAKHELEKRVKDQEEELDDLVGQVQLLE
ncbi:unconventional myosin-XVIIIa [Bombus impatiens]|uniref:Unconventional myosin-XVIIIa n=1 Tax=Bombus impatiens TaxID=132113 RepID=A0A6P3UQE7_BOMIM|nr:unconventional myosin-XVIIIa [Bombus impatiens]